MKDELCLPDWRALVEWGCVWQHPVRRGMPSQMIGAIRRDFLAYAILAPAEHTIRQHALSSASAEIGGLLLGDVYEERGSYLVVVAEAMPARHTQVASVNVTFTGETWLDLTARRGAFPDKMTVGWYHSHPGFGVFLSSLDSFIHHSFFGDTPWYLALVIDPISGEQAVFDRHGDVTPRVSCPGLDLGLGDEEP